MFALTNGASAVVAVSGSLYPVTTVLLAPVVLREELRRTRAAAVLTTVAGVALLSLHAA